MASIFLSHNRQDKRFVRKLAFSLRRCGASVWFDEAEMKVGDSLIYKIQAGIDSMEYLGVVLSPHSVKSEWVKKEVEVALNHEIAGKRVKVLPILAKTCDVPGFLQGKVYADFRKKSNWKKALGSLLDVLGLEDREDFDVFPGKQVMILRDFVDQLKQHFHPRTVEVEIFDESIEWIKVINEDKSFEVYGYSTTEDAYVCINKVFQRSGEPRIEFQYFPD